VQRGTVRRAVVTCLFVLAAGFGGGWWLSEQLDQSSRWGPDGAAPATYWTHSYLDVPGLYVADEHCHGQVRRLIEVGATGQAPHDACNPLRGAGSSYADLLDLPGGLAIVRRTEDGSAWRYGIEGQPRRVMPPPP
jgi:hypothetical protein